MVDEIVLTHHGLRGQTYLVKLKLEALRISDCGNVLQAPLALRATIDVA